MPKPAMQVATMLQVGTRALGGVKKSITSAVPSDDAVLVGSNLICAAIHQFGGAGAGRPGLRHTWG